MRKRRYRQVILSDSTEIAGISSDALAEKLFIDVDNDWLYYIASDGTPTIIGTSGGGGVVNLSVGAKAATTMDVDTDTGGTSATLTSATTSVAGLLSAADKTKLDGIESGAEVNNISDVNATDLTDAGDSVLHYHSADRNRANHTGTQTASTISDFDTEVSNNADVSDNTSKLVYRSITVSNTSGTTSIAATAKELILNDTIKTTGTGDFTVSGNEITIKNADDYQVSYNTSLNSLSGSNRSGYRAYLQHWNGSSWSTLTETTGSAYVRGTGDAEDAYGETEITAAVNDRIRLMAVRVSGSATNTFQQNGFTRVTVRRSV